MKIFQLHGYFFKTLAIIGGVSLGFLIIIISTLAYYMVVPLGHRATDDLASVITHAAETWDQMAIEKRPIFIEKMKTKHQLLLVTNNDPVDKLSDWLPYLPFLGNSLSQQLGKNIEVKESVDKDGEPWFWVDIPVSNGVLRFGFSRSRIGVNPPIVFFVILFVGFFLIIYTAVILTYRLTIPIERLYLAAKSVGKGQWPKPIKENGPEELVVLVKEFNKMSIQVKELLSNRTTLLAGIAHDLRTPLTQIQLALSMLPNEGGDPLLMQSIANDLDTINHLISETLSISLGLEEQNTTSIDINEELTTIISNIKKQNVTIEFSCGPPCLLNIQALAIRRILSNLLENAIRYGGEKPVTINCECTEKSYNIMIMDRGLGIPNEKIDAVFRPFYRLESSRGSGTGGSGLGLAIVKQLADANGWQVQLLVRPGGGTIAKLKISRN
jgi:two-component system osmolarity sensor histidine kinase EnvZ